MRVILAFAGGAVLAGGLVWLFVGQSNQPAQPAGSAAPAATSTVTPVAPAETQTAPAPAAPSKPSAWRAAKPKPKPAASEQPPVETAENAPPAQPPAAQPAQPAVVQPAAPAPTQPVEPIPPPPPPPPPPQPKTITLTAGTLLPVRLNETLSSDRNKEGDTFMATLDHPLIVEGFVIAERGSRVEGRVLTSEKAGKVKGVSELGVQLIRLNTSDGQRVDILTEKFVKSGPTTRNTDAAKVGGGAALGAIIGAIAGGGRGAAIGAGAGGAAGAGDVMLTRGKPAVLPVETRITFRLRDPVTITEKLR